MRDATQTASYSKTPLGSAGESRAGGLFNCRPRAAEAVQSGRETHHGRGNAGLRRGLQFPDGPEGGAPQGDRGARERDLERLKETFREDSDIDLAVVGLPIEAHFRVWAEVERDSEFKVDLQRMEELSDDFRRVVESYGKVLHERS